MGGEKGSKNINMVSELCMVEYPGFEPSPCNLIPICLFEVHEGLFGLFDSPRAGMGPHMRKGVEKHNIHIKLKSYKLELLEKLVPIFDIICFNEGK